MIATNNRATRGTQKRNNHGDISLSLILCTRLLQPYFALHDSASRKAIYSAIHLVAAMLPCLMIPIALG